MADSFARSLRLSEVLFEENQYLGPDAPKPHVAAATADSGGAATQSAADETGFAALDYQKLEDRARAVWANGTGATEPTKADYPYWRLAQWMKAEPTATADSGGAVLAEISVADALQKKLTTPTDELLNETAEAWLRNTASRSYTRGLLKQYDEQTRRKKQQWLDEHGRLLNQLLLEDAFIEYVKPAEIQQLEEALAAMSKNQRAALCLSGGGIRSATFALGVVQGLARLKPQSGENLLKRFTYLSTVSGGGYLGGWLSAWSHQVGFDTVINQLNGDGHTPLEPEAVPLRHLRQFSNYLSPRLGLMSADTWTLAATYLRNLLLVWLVIVPYLAAVAMLPWVAVTLTEFNGRIPEDWRKRVPDWVMSGVRLVFGENATGKVAVFVLLVVAAMILMTLALHFVHAYLPQQKETENRAAAAEANTKRNQSAFLWRCLLPIVAATLLWVVAWRWFTNWRLLLPWEWYRNWDETKPFGYSWLLNTGRDTVQFVVGGAAVHFLAWSSAVVVEIWKQKERNLGEILKNRGGRMLLFGFISLITGGIGGWILHKIGAALTESSLPVYLYTCLAVPGVVAALLLAGYAFEGISSSRVGDAQREWTARYSAWVLVVAVTWLALTGLVLYGPILVTSVGERLAAAGVGVGSGVLTALLGQSPKTGGAGEGAGSRKGTGNAPSLLGVLSSLTLPIVAVLTIVALFIGLSVVDMALMRWVGSLFDLPKSAKLRVPEMVETPFGIAVLVLVGLYLVGLLFSRLVNTNRFSMHALYRARLIRAYLGASRPPGERRPDPFTGFDDADNFPVGELAATASALPRKPFHVVNLALNLVAGQNLAWQERKAGSFTVSPLHAGATNLGYRRTSLPKSVGNVDAKNHLYGNPDTGISLGTAMTISGAAASPNMGYHSSPVIAFLMTLFNIRLGWWLGNPGPAGDETFYRREPKLAAETIFDELLANTDDTNPYVYLSDGGHFENLGLYEMVLRRNRFILVSDAGCDETCSLEDLGNAIRKIRIDLGVPIEFSENFKIRARSDNPAVPAGRYWALARIRYSAVDKPATGQTASETDGLLLYVKPGVYGNEPRDVFNYASANKAFPHESTGDQFFTESQFESYRALGLHVVQRIGEELGMPLENLFDPTERATILRTESWRAFSLKPPTVAGPGEFAA